MSCSSASCTGVGLPCHMWKNHQAVPHDAWTSAAHDVSTGRPAPDPDPPDRRHYTEYTIFRNGVCRHYLHWKLSQAWSATGCDPDDTTVTHPSGSTERKRSAFGDAASVNSSKAASRCSPPPPFCPCPFGQPLKASRGRVACALTLRRRPPAERAPASHRASQVRSGVPAALER